MCFLMEVRIHGVLGSSGGSLVLWSTYCSGAPTYPSQRSMLLLLRGSGTSRDQKQPTEGCTPCGGDHDATVADNASGLTAASEPSHRLLVRSVGGGSGVGSTRSNQGSSCRRRCSRR